MTIVACDIVRRPGKVEQLMLEMVSVGAQVWQQMSAELLAANGVDLDPVNDLSDEVSLSGLETIHTQQSVEFSV